MNRLLAISGFPEVTLEFGTRGQTWGLCGSIRVQVGVEFLASQVAAGSASQLLTQNYKSHCKRSFFSGCAAHGAVSHCILQQVRSPSIAHCLLLVLHTYGLRCLPHSHQLSVLAV